MSTSPHLSLLADAGYAIEGVILILCSFPAWFLAHRGSKWLVPYVVAAWAFGPEVRRINDWIGGGYQRVTMLSLIPMVASLALTLPIGASFRDLPARLRRPLLFVTAAIVYGAAVGLFSAGPSSVYEALELLLPLLLVPYAAARPYVEKERDLWLSSLSTIAAMVAAYGLYQFMVAPEWDMEWMVRSGMAGSMGSPRPMSFRVFSTLNSAGPLALFVGASLTVGLCGRRWRGPLGLLGSGLTASCLLLSQVRVAWVMVAVGITTFIAISRGASRRAAIAAVIIAGGLTFGAQYVLPGSDAVLARVGTFTDLRGDHSVQARIGLSFDSLGGVLSTPFGHGLGTTGVGGKLSRKDDVNGGMDNGYLDLGMTLGAPMAFVLIAGVVLLGVEARRRGRAESTQPGAHASLAVAMLAAYLFGIVCFNILGGACGVMLWLVIGAALRTRRPRKELLTFLSLRQGDVTTRRARRR